MRYENYTHEAVELLKQLIAIPSVSREEAAAANLLYDYAEGCGLHCHRSGNNVWIMDEEGYSPLRPTVLLNAHIDTVRPSASWTRSPFVPQIEDDRLYGLGSNDDGGGLVSLLQVYRIMNAEFTPFYNIVFLASCEEEVSGAGGITSVLPMLPKIDVAIVGEPTDMQPAIAEKGLMVIDGVARGRAGHAARNEGVNAIYEALDDFVWIRDHKFPRVSPLLGDVKMSLTVVGAGRQHNVIPDECRFVIDVRSNELYTNEELFNIIQTNVRSELKARSFRLNSSHINIDHPVVRRCMSMGLQPYGSPTLSDQALMPFPSVKLGPGKSCRSHTADEFILLSEIGQAIPLYVQLLKGLEFEKNA